MSEYFIYYTESNIVCVIIFGIMLVHDLSSMDRQEKQIKYDYALIAFMLYFLNDAVWAAVLAGILQRNIFTVVSTNFINYVIMAEITYRWLDFVMAVEQAPHRGRAINKFAVRFPFLVSTAILIATWFFAPQVLLNDAFELQPAYNLFLIGVPTINIIAVLFYALRKARHEENPMEKKKHLYIGFFPLMVIMGGLLQMIVLPSTPIFCFCCTILMLIFFVQSMDTQISLDPLTRLNNRGQLFRYVSQKGNLYVEGRTTYVAMIDVNDFKAINDTYGHAEGDRALMILADSLKKATGSCSAPIFLGRYGGDEFIIIAHPEDEDEFKRLILEIRAKVEAECRAAAVPYILSVGIGYDELLREQDSFQQCMQRADRKLYTDKEYCKSHGHPPAVTV